MREPDSGAEGAAQRTDNSGRQPDGAGLDGVRADSTGDQGIVPRRLRGQTPRLVPDSISYVGPADPTADAAGSCAGGAGGQQSTVCRK